MYRNIPGSVHPTFTENWVNLDNGRLSGQIGRLTYNLHNSQVWKMLAGGASTKGVLLQYSTVVHSK